MSSSPRSLGAHELITQVVDPGSWSCWDAPPNRAGDSAEYLEALENAASTSGVDESVTTGEATVHGHRVALAAGEFGFLAGSVGREAARRLVAGVRRATREGLPLLAAPVSGGTRMQEGTPAFVHMVAIAEAVAAHKQAGLPYLVYLRHPTTGGVMASWGSLGHVTAAEPGALLGFLGPRVYQALYDEPFPDGVQTAENLYAHGLVDAVLPAEELRDVAGRALSLMADGLTSTVAERDAGVGAGGGSTDGGADPGPGPADDAGAASTVDAWESVTRSRHSGRPGVRDLLELAATQVLVLRGTGEGDPGSGMVLALARFGDTACVLAGEDRQTQAVTPMGPGALRTARRGMRLATELGLPLVTVVDTPGAELSAAAEEGGLAGQIARSLGDLVTLSVPSLCLMLGEGNGGGALALLPADRVVAAQHAWLSPLPPEGASAIVHRNIAHADVMARAQRVRAQDLAEAGVVDRIVAERPDAAEESEGFCRRVGEVLATELAALVRRGPGTPRERSVRYGG